MKQMEYEIDSWLRTLEFVKEENTLLKHRLAEMVRLNTDKHQIRQAEEFQKFFLDNDTIIAMLKNDIHKHRQLLAENGYNDEASKKNARKFQQILRGDMDKFEKNFSGLQLDFNTYLDDCTDDYQVAA